MTTRSQTKRKEVDAEEETKQHEVNDSVAGLLDLALYHIEKKSRMSDDKRRQRAHVHMLQIAERDMQEAFEMSDNDAIAAYHEEANQLFITESANEE